MDWGHNCSHVDAVPVHHGEQTAKYKSEDLNLLFALHPYPWDGVTYGHKLWVVIERTRSQIQA